MVDLLLTMITNSFKIPFIQKPENILIFHSFLCTEIYSIYFMQMIKISETEVHLFYANADIKIMFTSFKKVH